jgi:arylsulfatase A-like enzyme/Flp pilus assembly protein TadD
MTCSVGRWRRGNNQGRPFVSFVPFVSLASSISFASFVVTILSTVLACSRTPATPNAHLQSGSLAGSNLLLVTIDTLRADRVGAYSATRSPSLTPALDRLAASGVRFTQAHAHAPMTLPAHTSILTGLVPPGHGVRNNGSTALASGTPTLASVLHDAGYRTGAFVGAFVLDARFGLSRGFDAYDDRVGSDTGPITFAFAERTADRVTALAADWILSPASPAARDQRPTANDDRPTARDQRPTTNDQRLTTNDQRPRSSWFCWMHLFDPHAPYRAPEQRVADPYDNEVAFADAQLGKLFDRLRTAGQLDSTLVVVVADHGESLGEHGEATHGLFAYEATIHIPLIVAGPSIRPAIVDAPTGQADLVPTVLDLLGVAPPARLDGQSLLPAIRGEPAADRPVYFEALDAYLTRNWAPLTGVVFEGWKYIDVPDAELYDLRSDPGESRNRLRDEAPRAAALGKRLSEFTAPSPARAAPAPIDADAAARLRALGYTASQAREARRTRYTTADDPKRLLDLDRRYERALTLAGERNYGEAAALLQSVIADRPDFTVAYLNLASIFIAGGDPKRAVALLEAAATHGVTSPELQGRLGAAHLASGDPNRAAATLEPVARADGPGGLEAMNSLAIALTQRGSYDRARQLLSDVLERSPRSATTWSNLGLLELSAHRSAEAGRAFEQAVAADPRLGQAWEGLGAARARSDPSGTIDAWKHAVDVDPHNYDVLFNLSVMLRQQGRGVEARPYIERFVREAPPDRYSRDIAVMRGWQ